MRNLGVMVVVALAMILVAPAGGNAVARAGERALLNRGIVLHNLGHQRHGKSDWRCRPHCGAEAHLR